MMLVPAYALLFRLGHTLASSVEGGGDMGCVVKLYSLLFDHGGSGSSSSSSSSSSSNSSSSSSYLVLSYERPPATIVLAMSGQSFEQVARGL